MLCCVYLRKCGFTFFFLFHSEIFLKNAMLCLFFTQIPGIYLYLSSFVQDAVSLARAEDEAEAAARKLTEAAFNRGSADNITCIVVRLHHEKAKAKANPANPESDKAGPASSQPE